MTDRVLPHDLAAERAVLGGVMISPELLPFVLDLEPEEFYRQAHGQIWSALRSLDEAASAIDLLTLRARLEREGLLEGVGGQSYLVDLADGVPRASNVEHYAAIVRAHAAQRTKIGAYRQLIEACYQDPDDAEATAADAEGALAQLEMRQASGEQLLDVDGQIAALLEDLELDRTGSPLHLGLPALDAVLEGIRPSEVLDIWARPGIGKTLLLCHALIAIVEWNAAMCFSLEMRAAQIVRRLCRMAFGLTNVRLRQHGFDQALYRERFARLTLDASPGLTVAQMEARVRRLQQTGTAVRAVFVDHLGLIGGDRKMSTYDRTSLQARELKELAKRRNVAVIRLVQVSRDAGGDGSRELHLGSARDSGVVEESADYILGFRRLDRSTTLPLHEREKYKDVLFGKVIKHRHGSPPDREFGYRIDDQTIVLREDLSVRPEAADVAGLAQKLGGRR